MYMSSWDKLSLKSYKEKYEKLEKENEKYLITFSSLYDNDKQYTTKIQEQEHSHDTMSGQLAELNNTVKIQQTKILDLKECLFKKDSENEHLKSKIVDFTTVQNLRAQVKELQGENEHLNSKVIDFTMVQTLQVQVEELKSVNESLNLSVEELSKARALVEATLRKRDEMVFAQCEKIRLLEEQSEPFYEVQSEFDSEIVHDTHDNSEKDVILSLQTQLKEYAELGFSKHDTSLEKLIEMIDKEYESNVLKISITSSTFETKNLELVNEMGDIMKCFDEEKKAFETKISKLEKVLAQRVKDFNDVKTELSKRIDKFETYFANLEKQNALLKSQLASQNYTSLQKENNDLRTSYNVLKEKYGTSCEKLEKENNDLKMHYKRLFDSIKQKKVDSQVFTKSIPKVNVSEKIYTGKFLKPISKKVSQFTTYSLQKDMKYLKKQHSSKTFSYHIHVKNERLKQAWKRKENISKPFKYSRDEMFSMCKRDDSVLKKVKDVRFPFISKRIFQSETPIIMEYLVKISKKARILELKRRYLKITVLTPNTPYPSRKIRRICACTSQKTTKETRSNTPYPGKTNTPYSSYGNKIFWKISNVVPTPRNPQYAVSKTFDTPY
ncbi:hypothetical protein Tco_1019025 [Tanacetum coccineum]|uniref:Uncharacterized protein n=1 Tax=Tanacetum coccineum TaxID=301880 RepID=A0ABQ5FXF8_9ASTR